jgi:hypothetical protein
LSLKLLIFVAFFFFNRISLFCALSFLFFLRVMMDYLNYRWTPAHGQEHEWRLGVL